MRKPRGFAGFSAKGLRGGAGHAMGCISLPMKIIHCVLSVLLCLCLGACEKEQSLAEKQREIETGKLDESLAYTAEEIGWSTQAPKGWKVMTRDATKDLQETGAGIIEKTTDVELDMSGLKQLLNLSKDEVNILLSTMEPYDEAVDGSWLENNKTIYEVVLKSYAEAGLKVGKTGMGVETLDGLEFQTWEIELLRPSGEGVVLTQKMYSRLINGYDVGITLTTNNEKTRAELQQLLEVSKFSKRESVRK